MINIDFNTALTLLTSVPPENSIPVILFIIITFYIWIKEKK